MKNDLKAAEITPESLEYLSRALAAPDGLATVPLPFPLPCAFCEIAVTDGCYVHGAQGLACERCALKSYLIGLLECIATRPAGTRKPLVIEELDPCGPECPGHETAAEEPLAIVPPSSGETMVSTALTPPAPATPPVRDTALLSMAKHAGGGKTPQEITVKAGDKVDILSLPAGTVVRFESQRGDAIDRTPVGPGFNISSVPLLDRDLVRYEGDPEVGPATMRPYDGTIRIARQKVALESLPDHVRPFFEDEVDAEGNVGGDIVYRMHDLDVEDKEVSEAVLAADRETYGDEEMDEALRLERENEERRSLRRDGKTATLTFPARCGIPD